MSALPLRLALVALAAAVPFAIAACAGDASHDTSSGESALTGVDEGQFESLILEAFGSSTASNFQKSTADHSCVSSDPGTSVYDWNAVGGQWMAPALRAYMTVKKVTEQVTVVETPASATGHIDVAFYAIPKATDANAAPPSLCAPAPNADADAGPELGGKVLVLTCKDIVATGPMATITPGQCTRPN